MEDGRAVSYLPGAMAYEFFVKPSGHFLHNDGEIYGRTEVLLCRKHPEYRLHSELAGFGKNSMVEAFSTATDLFAIPAVACRCIHRADLGLREAMPVPVHAEGWPSPSGYRARHRGGSLRGEGSRFVESLAK